MYFFGKNAVKKDIIGKGGKHPMTELWIKSPENDIPIIKIIWNENSDPFVECKNMRTSKTEQFPLADFIQMLIKYAFKIKSMSTI